MSLPPPLQYFLLPNLYLHISKKSTAIELPFFCTTAQHLLLHLWVHVRLSQVSFFLFFFIIFIINVSLFLAEMLACRSKLCLNQGSSRVSLTWLRQKQSEHVLRAHRTGAPVLAVNVTVRLWNNTACWPEMYIFRMYESWNFHVALFFLEEVRQHTERLGTCYPHSCSDCLHPQCLLSVQWAPWNICVKKKKLNILYFYTVFVFSFVSYLL